MDQDAAGGIAPGEGEAVLGGDRLTAAGATWQVERAFPFFNYVLVTGAVRHPASRPTVVALAQGGTVVSSAVFQPPPGPGVPARFELFALLPEPFRSSEMTAVFRFDDGSTYLLPWDELVRGRAAADPGSGASPHDLFLRSLRERLGPAVLEIGSRARSGVSRRGLFRGMDYVGLDVLAGDNVDIVGDAHELSSLLEGRRFDGVYSVSTFEHLLMPWKVALEINRVLHTGGVCFIHTHQALGMHDMPWDYWRYSDTAWHALFNRRTGFEVLATRLDEPMLLVPATYTDHWRGYEGSLGFATSAVTVRKIADTDLSWDVAARDVAVGDYPE